MSTPKAATGSPLALQPPGLTSAGNKLCVLFYEKDVATGLPTGLVYDEAGNLIPAPNFPTGTGLVKMTADVQGLAVAGTDYVAPGTDRALTASGNAVLADNQASISCNHATVAVVVTIPPQADVVWPAGAELTIYMAGAAAASFAAGAGVTLKDVGGVVAALVQYGKVTAKRVSENLWVI